MHHGHRGADLVYARRVSHDLPLAHAAGRGVTAMNIQIFGTKKCQDSRKAERYFKERGVKFQFIDLKEKEMSAGELHSVAAKVGGMEALLDKAGKHYLDKGLKYASFSAGKLEQMLVEDPLLLKTPV